MTDKLKEYENAVWQPVGTAPDCTVILIWGEDYTTPIFAAWCDLAKRWLTFRDMKIVTAPSHWMPVPKMPKEE